MKTNILRSNPKPFLVRLTRFCPWFQSSSVLCLSEFRLGNPREGRLTVARANPQQPAAEAVEGGPCLELAVGVEERLAQQYPARGEAVGELTGLIPGGAGVEGQLVTL